MSARASADWARAAWPDLISGVVMIVAGVGTWLHPEWFVPLIGAVVVIEGGRLAWEGLFARHGDGLDGARLAVGLLAIVLGLALWLYPDKTAPAVLYTVSAWAIVFGLFIALLGLQARGADGRRWSEVILGLLLAAFGIAIWTVPQGGALTLVTVFSALVVASGIMRIFGAFHRHSAADR